MGSNWTTAPLYQRTGGVYYWYLNDHLGTPQKLINVNGTAKWSAVYDSFGKAQINTEYIKNNLRFGGQYFDAETGLHYNFNRYYDPQTGRYLRVDPSGDGLNPYAYVYNNPLLLRDPLGLCAAGGSSYLDQMFDFSWWGNAASVAAGKGWAWGYEGNSQLEDTSMGNRLWYSYANLMEGNAITAFYLEHSGAFLQGALNATRAVSMISGAGGMIPPAPAVATAGFGTMSVAASYDLTSAALGLGGTVMMAQNPDQPRKIAKADVNENAIVLGMGDAPIDFANKYGGKVHGDLPVNDLKNPSLAQQFVDMMHKADRQIWTVLDNYKPDHPRQGFTALSGATRIGTWGPTPIHGCFSFELYTARFTDPLWDKVCCYQNGLWVPAADWLEHPSFAPAAPIMPPSP